MARLPQPGGDRGDWGGILNEYLTTSLDTDGSIKDEIVTEAKLSPAVKTKLNNVANGGVADDSIMAVHLQSNAVTNVKIQDGAVTTAKIQDNAVVNTKIPNGSISAVKLDTGVQASLTKADSALQAAPVTSVATKTGAVSLVKADVGLENVDNTTDAAKPISSAVQTALNAKANTNDARFTDARAPLDGSVTAAKISAGVAAQDQILSYDGTGLAWTTPTASGNITDATPSVKGIVQLAGDLSGTAGSPTVARVNGIAVTGTPSNGQVLTATSASAANWQAAATGGGTVTAANITDASATGRSVLTGADAAAIRTTLSLGNVNNTSDANKPISSATQTALDAKAALASPSFTGTPTAPTPTAGDNDTSVATTAFVVAAINATLAAVNASPVYVIYYDTATASWRGQGGVVVPATAPTGVLIRLVDKRGAAVADYSGPKWNGVSDWMPVSPE